MRNRSRAKRKHDRYRLPFAIRSPRGLRIPVEDWLDAAALMILTQPNDYR